MPNPETVEGCEASKVPLTNEEVINFACHQSTIRDLVTRSLIIDPNKLCSTLASALSYWQASPGPTDQRAIKRWIRLSSNIEITKAPCKHCQGTGTISIAPAPTRSYACWYCNGKGTKDTVLWRGSIFK